MCVVWDVCGGDGQCGRAGLGRRLCVLPAVDQAMDGLDQAVLGDGIEKAYQILVDCIKIHANWGVLKVVVEVVPKLRNGELSW